MLLHLSDPHFGTEDASKVSALRQLCLDLKPELVVVSGDLTQRARQRQFSDAKNFLDSLGCPYLVIPGNHDIPLFHLPRRFWQPFQRYQHYFGSLQPHIETEHFYVLGLNTIKSHHHTKGSISTAQIEHVAACLTQAPLHKLKVLVSHQPFVVGAHEASAAKDIPRLTLPALTRWAACGLDMVLHGHLHQCAVYDLNHHFKLGNQHAILDVHAGTALSHRLRHNLPNSVNVIDRQLNASQLNASELNIMRYDYDEDRQCFMAKKSLWP